MKSLFFQKIRATFQFHKCPSFSYFKAHYFQRIKLLKVSRRRKLGNTQSKIRTSSEKSHAHPKLLYKTTASLGMTFKSPCTTLASCFTNLLQTFAEQSGILQPSGTGEERVCDNNVTAVLMSKGVTEETCRSRQHLFLEQLSSLGKLSSNQKIHYEIWIRGLLNKMWTIHVIIIFLNLLFIC